MAFTKLSVHRKHLRLVETQQEIFDQREPDDRDRAFLAQQLIQATLPHRNPRGNPPIWTRKNGNLTLSIQPGYALNEKTGKKDCLGYPSGSIPRLLLYWLNTEVVRTKNRRIELGDNV